MTEFNVGRFPVARRHGSGAMATPDSGAPWDADLWSSHDKMLVQPLKDSDLEVRLRGFSGVLSSASHRKAAVLRPALWAGVRG